MFGGTYDFGVFLAVPLPFIFYGKREEAERRPKRRPPPPIVILKTERRKGKLSV